MRTVLEGPVMSHRPYSPLFLSGSESSQVSKQIYVHIPEFLLREQATYEVHCNMGLMAGKTRCSGLSRDGGRFATCSQHATTPVRCSAGRADSHELRPSLPLAGTLWPLLTCE